MKCFTLDKEGIATGHGGIALGETAQGRKRTIVEVVGGRRGVLTDAKVERSPEGVILCEGGSPREVVLLKLDASGARYELPEGTELVGKGLATGKKPGRSKAETWAELLVIVPAGSSVHVRTTWCGNFSLIIAADGSSVRRENK